MAEQLNGSLCFEPTFDSVLSKRLDANRKLSFRDAWLHTERFNQNVSRAKFRHGNFIQSKIAKSIKTPGTHQWFLD